jgi:hypothetical protein
MNFLSPTGCAAGCMPHSHGVSQIDIVHTRFPIDRSGPVIRYPRHEDPRSRSLGDHRSRMDHGGLRTSRESRQRSALWRMHARPRRPWPAQPSQPCPFTTRSAPAALRPATSATATSFRLMSIVLSSATCSAHGAAHSETGHQMLWEREGAVPRHHSVGIDSGQWALNAVGVSRRALCGPWRPPHRDRRYQTCRRAERGPRARRRRP